MAAEKTYKIRKGSVKYSYLIGIPLNIVEKIGLHARVKYDIVNDREIKLTIVEPGEQFKIVKKKTGPKSIKEEMKNLF